MPVPPLPPEDRADYESVPLTRTEYIQSIVHLYRGELYRANSWRMRLDNTTNWAVITTAGLLSLSFREQANSHAVLVVGLALITVFWGFEARRYRYADIWYARVRKIEENFYGPILRRDPVSPEHGWGDLVAEDLFSPQFKISRLESLRARLLRNYWAIYAILLLAWGYKLVLHPRVAYDWQDVQGRLELGVLPWWSTLLAVGLFVLVLIAVLLFGGPGATDEHDHWRTGS